MRSVLIEAAYITGLNGEAEGERALAYAILVAAYAAASITMILSRLQSTLTSNWTKEFLIGNKLLAAGRNRTVVPFHPRRA